MSHTALQPIGPPRRRLGVTLIQVMDLVARPPITRHAAEHTPLGCGLPLCSPELPVLSIPRHKALLFQIPLQGLPWRGCNSHAEFLSTQLTRECHQKQQGCAADLTLLADCNPNPWRLSSAKADSAACRLRVIAALGGGPDSGKVMDYTWSTRHPAAVSNCWDGQHKDT
ncbi:hypothetical protein VTK26DRAFT_2941 [Humicola hyalothermophila]